jgi:hypothetical protein
MMIPAQFEAYCVRLSITHLGRQYLRIVREGVDGRPAARSLITAKGLHNAHAEQ